MELLEAVPAMGRDPVALPFVLQALQSLCPAGVCVHACMRSCVHVCASWLLGSMPNSKTVIETHAAAPTVIQGASEMNVI